MSPPEEKTTETNTGTTPVAARQKLSDYEIGRRLTFRRQERRLLQRAVQQIVQTPLPRSAQEFKAEVDAPTVVNTNRPAPKPLPSRRAVANADWQQAYGEWIQSHAERPSGLTPDMLRRENLYGGDE